MAPLRPVYPGDEHSEIRWFPIAEAALLPDLAVEAYRALFRSLVSRP